MKTLLEVHKPRFVSGPRSKSIHYEITHSHADGSISHMHRDTGPSCYGIDKDVWAMTTGLRGGGRKKFTTKPIGEQFPLTPEDES